MSLVCLHGWEGASGWFVCFDRCPLMARMPCRRAAAEVEPETVTTSRGSACAHSTALHASTPRSCNTFKVRGPALKAPTCLLALF